MSLDVFGYRSRRAFAYARDNFSCRHCGHERRVGKRKSLKHLLQVNHPLIGELWEHGLVKVFLCPCIRFVSLCLRCSKEDIAKRKPEVVEELKLKYGEGYPGPRGFSFFFSDERARVAKRRERKTSGYLGLESHFHADAGCQTRQIYNYKTVQWQVGNHVLINRPLGITNQTNQSY